MEQKKKFTFTVILGLAGLWFVFTNFCLPTLKDNTLRLAEYRKLREDTRIIEGFDGEKFRIWDEKIAQAKDSLEERFLGEGRMNFAPQLTRLPADSNIELLDLKQKEVENRQNYEIFPVDIVMKAQFFDLVRYLAAIDTSPLLIGVESLRVTKPVSEAKDLDVRLTFAGFRLMHKPKTTSAYLEERFKPFDEGYFNNLIGPVGSRKTTNLNLIAGLYNPFLSVYEPGQDKTRLIKVAEEFSLRGTLRIAGKNAALINNEIVREGQFIQGAEVVQIVDGMVVLMRSGKREVLKMGVKDGFNRP